MEVKTMRTEGTRGGEQNLGGILANLQPHLSFLPNDYFHGWPLCFWISLKILETPKH